MASSDEVAFDIAFLVAALVEEAGGELRLSDSWFTGGENPFYGSRLRLTSENGYVVITLEEEN